MTSLARIGWGVTGAGHLLPETFEVMEKLVENHEISCFLSCAAERVIRVYGLSRKLSEICPGGYYREIISEAEEGPASPLAGRFLRKTYDALIVSPASANTVAKVALGISDTLVTNAITQAEKGRVPIIIVPTDQFFGEMKTRLPYFIDRILCEKCGGCQVIDLCPVRAIISLDSLPRIDLSKCDGCGICLSKCPQGAVSFGKEVTVMAREIDVKNVQKLRENANFAVLTKPGEIPDALRRMLSDKGE